MVSAAVQRLLLLSVWWNSLNLAARHLNFAYVLTIQICYFALFSCYYTTLIKTVNGNINSTK